MKTKANMMVLAVAVVGLAGCLLAGCGTTRTYNMPYSRAEAVLFERLHLDGEQTLTSPHSVQAKAEDDLAKPMSMKLFAVDLHAHMPGTRLSFTCHHLYNIGAVGGQYIRFDLQKRNESETRITVDYCDRWYGMWPPFVFWNPGLGRERSIHVAIWQAEPARPTSNPIVRPRAEGSR